MRESLLELMLFAYLEHSTLGNACVHFYRRVSFGDSFHLKLSAFLRWDQPAFASKIVKFKKFRISKANIII
jgi:hypothetical protein